MPRSPHYARILMGTLPVRLDNFQSLLLYNSLRYLMGVISLFCGLRSAVTIPPQECYLGWPGDCFAP